MRPNVIVTSGPYAPYMNEVVRHTIVSGIRLNTIMPVKDPLEDVLKRMHEITQRHAKDLWVDLKYRQLRVKTFGVPPFTEIELTQEITVDTPCRAYFSNGAESAIVLKADKNRLIMQDGPRRVIGPGESVNIPDGNLHVLAGFTDTDKRYIEAMNKLNLHKYMLSFVERKEDVYELHGLDTAAEIVAKIESRKGISYVEQEHDGKTRLMAARGDLFIELRRPHEIIEALETIIAKDENAIVASRILESLTTSMEPSCEDISDIDNLLRMGYRTLMLGDQLCLQRDNVMNALNLLEVMVGRYV